MSEGITLGQPRVDHNRPKVKIVAFACADSRFMMEVVRKEVATQFDVQPDEVSVLTFYGPDLALATDTIDRASAVEAVRAALGFWPVERIVFTGHENCRANDASKEDHVLQMETGIRYFRQNVAPDVEYHAIYFKYTASPNKFQKIINMLWNLYRPDLGRKSDYGWRPERLS